MISSVAYARENANANQRQMAVAANAVRTEQATVGKLLEAIQQSSAYNASGQPGSGGIGTRFAASA